MMRMLTCLLVYLLVGVMAFSANTAQAAPIDIETKASGTYRFDVIIASTRDHRTRGLMGVTRMADDKGMLFVFPHPHVVAFWMKNTLMPLDILYINKDYKIVRIHQNAQPNDLTPLSSGVGVKYALELRGGLAQKLNISEGDTLVLHDSLKGLEIN